MTITSIDRLYQPAPLPQEIVPFADKINWGEPCCMGLLWVTDLDGGNRRPCPECVSDELAEKMT